jgi:hypothetical protein
LAVGGSARWVCLAVVLPLLRLNSRAPLRPCFAQLPPVRNHRLSICIQCELRFLAGGRLGLALSVELKQPLPLGPIRRWPASSVATHSCKICTTCSKLASLASSSTCSQFLLWRCVLNDAMIAACSTCSGSLMLCALVRSTVLGNHKRKV